MHICSSIHVWTLYDKAELLTILEFANATGLLTSMSFKDRERIIRELREGIA